MTGIYLEVHVHSASWFKLGSGNDYRGKVNEDLGLVKLKIVRTKELTYRLV